MRVLLSVSVLITGTTADGKKFEEETRTVVVNAHGALIFAEANLTTGQRLEITHKMTRESKECRVVYLSSPQGGKFQVGIEFIKPSPAFWRIDFPPDDWVVPED